MCTQIAPTGEGERVEGIKEDPFESGQLAPAASDPIVYLLQGRTC